MQLSAPIAHQPVRVAIFRHGSARSVPTARYDRVADDFYQRVRDLVPRFFETLVTAAIVLWNTVYLQRAVDYLRKLGNHPAPTDLTHL